MDNQELNPQFLKIRQYINVIISHWQRTNASDPLFKDLREAMKTDTLKEYNELVKKLYLDAHFMEGDTLQKIIDEVESKLITHKKY